MINKKSLSERDICTKYITPAIEKSGWGRDTHFLEEVYFTDGRIYVRGRLVARGKAKKADYILYYKPNIPIPLPPLAEQTRIVEKLNILMQHCDELKTSIEHSKDLNDRLLKATLREALN